MAEATLFNPDTKERIATGGEGQPIAQDLFSEGFKLETSFDESTGVSTFDDPNINAGIDTTITPESLEATPEITIPEVTEPVGDPNADVAGAEQASSDTDAFIESLTPETTETEEEKSDILSSLVGLTEEFGQAPADQLEAEQEAGIPILKADLADVQGQIAVQLAEYRDLNTRIEGKPISMSSIIGQQAQVQRAKASSIGILQAQELSLQGKITQAQNTVNRAIDLKYSVVENNINVYEAQLRAIQPQLNKEQQQQATRQQLMLDEYRQDRLDTKQEEKDINNFALTAQQNGADSALVSQIANATTQLEAQEIAGELGTSEGWQYVATPAQRDALIAQGYEITQAGGRTYARQPDPAVESYAQQIMNGQIKLANVPADLRNEVSAKVGSSIVASSGGGGGNVGDSKILQEQKAGKNQWTQSLANSEYDRFIKAGYTPQDAVDSVRRITGFTPKGANYTSSNIPTELKQELITNIQSGESLNDLSVSYGDVSSSYLNSLYNQYKKEVESNTKTDDGITDEEFIQFFNNNQIYGSW